MLRKATALLLLAACAVHADTNNPETLAERSQATARGVLDRAVAAIGGAEALRSIDVVRLQLQGETWPRLQMPTAAPPFEAGTAPQVGSNGNDTGPWRGLFWCTPAARPVAVRRMCRRRPPPTPPLNRFPGCGHLGQVCRYP